METDLFHRFFEVEDRHWWFVARRDIVLDQVAQFGRGGRILDLGCGTGGVMAHLGTYGEAYGIDPTLEAITYSGKRGLSVARASGFDMPFPDEAFDTILSLDVIEHVEDDIGLLREAYRVLKPGGVMVITVPALPWLWSYHDVVNHHYRRYVKSSLRKAVCGAGFEVDKLTYYNALLLPVAAARKWINRLASSEDHLEELPRPVNTALREILATERPILRRVNLPLGASLVCVVRRPV